MPAAAAGLEVRPLSRETEADFFKLREHESCDWCFCAAWHVPTWEGWTDRSADENRTLRRRLFAEGRYDGYLLYSVGDPVGWCQCCPLEWLPKLARQFELEGEPAGTYMVGCVEILPEFRKKGLSYVMLRAVIDHLNILRVRRVLAVPRSGARADGEVWTGPLALFESLGFSPVKRVGDRRVMRLGL